MSIKEKLAKKAPLLLTAGAIGFTIGAVVTAVKGKPKYDALMENAEELAKKEDREVTRKEKAIIFGRAYGPTVVCVCASAACAIVNEKVHNDRLAKSVAEGAAAVAFVETRFRNYRELAEQRLKPKQVEEIKDDLVKKKVEDVFKDIPEGAKIKKYKLGGPPEGERIILDTFSGTLFYGDAQELSKAHFNFVKKNFMNGQSGDVPVKWWYVDCGIPIDFDKCKAIKRLGWREGHAPSTELRWTTTSVPSGPYAGEAVWAFMFDTNDEPEQIDDWD